MVRGTHRVPRISRTALCAGVWYGWFVLNRSATNRNTSKALGRLRSRGSRLASLTVRLFEAPRSARRLATARCARSLCSRACPGRLPSVAVRRSPHSVRLTVAVLPGPDLALSVRQGADWSTGCPWRTERASGARGAPTSQAARDRRSLGPLARQRRARTPQADGRGAQRGPREARQGRTRARTSQRRPEGADRLPVVAAPRAPRGLSRCLHRGKRKLTQSLYTHSVPTKASIQYPASAEGAFEERLRGGSLARTE